MTTEPLVTLRHSGATESQNMYSRRKLAKVKDMLSGDIKHPYRLVKLENIVTESEEFVSNKWRAGRI